MSAKLRYWTLVGMLVTGVAAVSVVGAQGGPPPRETPERGARRGVTMLDGGGSRLGVMVQDLDPGDKASGVRVDSVEPGGPADQAGIKAGDVVVEFDGERVRSTRQLTRLVRETPEGRQVPLVVMRDGKRQTLTATPEATSMTWNMSIDGDRIRRDVERGLEGLREFQMEIPPMRFRYDDDFSTLAPGPRRRLGISVDTMSDQLAQYFGAKDGGALITSVEPGSAAAKAGLEAGDVVTTINGTPVRSADQVGRALRDAGDGEITIGYLRDRKAGTTKATIEPTAMSQPRAPRRPVRPAAYRPA